MKFTNIEWTDSTWNPVTGCNHVSNGCVNCYAERMAVRLKAMGNPRYTQGFKLRMHEDLTDLPLRWVRPQTIFVNSMSDLFHEHVSDEFIKKIFITMNKAHWHQFQLLTKRPFRMAKMADQLTWSSNIWMGVTIESQRYIRRISLLRRVPATVRFISFEPLLSKIDTEISLEGIHWAIVGGESGLGARPMDKQWVLDIQSMCGRDGTAFFFKQWGGVNRKKTGRTLKGKTWDAMPEPLIKPDVGKHKVPT